MKRKSIFIISLLGILSLIGCSPSENEKKPKEVVSVTKEAHKELPNNDNQESSLIKEKDKQHGYFVEGEQLILNENQEELILQYFEMYYKTLATLEYSDVSELFSDENNIFIDLHEQVWDYMLEVRKMQSVDLRMIDYAYAINEVQMDVQEEVADNSIKISLIVDESFWFEEYPEIKAQEYGTTHYFSLVEVEGRWKIREHLERGTLYWKFFSDHDSDQEEWSQASVDIFERSKVNRFENAKKKLLDLARQNVNMRMDENKEIENVEVEHPYDRIKAIEYAQQWIDTRNNTWFDYSEYGGNCQNFASQSLLAGGIPMDINGYQWKWYGDTPNEKVVERGRAPAWTGVDKFVEYAQNNSGYGLVATVDAPYYSGEIGDLLILGYNENWRHTVIITEIIKDDQGNTVDYLVASNTSDQRDFPVSAYMYTRQMLVKIHGWNE